MKNNYPSLQNVVLTSALISKSIQDSTSEHGIIAILSFPHLLSKAEEQKIHSWLRLRCQQNKIKLLVEKQE